jgi:thioredoxin reductase (NADPH)
LAGQTQPVRLPCTWPDSPPGVTLLVRGESLVASVSDYLITQLKATPDIGVRLRTRVAGGHGQARLEALTLEDVRTGQREQVPAAAVLVVIGAGPRTQWRRDLVKLNNRGFILTGRDVPPGAWPLPRPPCRSRRARQAIKTLAA